MRRQQYTDEWSGDQEALTGLGAESPGPDAHEHAHHDGCFYAHEHEGGTVPHSHTGPCEDPGCRHSYAPEHP